MSSDIAVEMMAGEFLLWRCLHDGPLTEETLEQPTNPNVPWDQLQARNLPLLAKLTDVYGACAVLARDGERVVGQLRFYPKAVCDMAAAGPALCLQQIYPNGPADDFVDNVFPPLDKLADKTLFVHCMMTGSPQQQENRYQRKGLGSRLVRTLVDWAQAKGWEAIEAHAYADLPCIYSVTGQAGRTFWEKLGFRVVETTVEPAFAEGAYDDFIAVLLQEASERGVSADAAKAKHRMRLELA